MTLLFTLVSSAPPDNLVRALDHHALFLLLVQISILLFSARLLGEIARKLGQPPVIGELLAGVLLGPSVFGAIAPDVQRSIFPMIQHQSDLLAVVSWIGVLFLLIVTGLETDLGLIKRRGRSALVISAGGIIVPFATGLALGWLIPDAYLADPQDRLVFSLFIAVAMSISAVPVIAKVLLDLGLTRRDIGQLILASAMADDTVGWILLSVVAGLATAGVVSVSNVAWSIGGAILVLGVSFTVGASIISRVISVIDKLFGGVDMQITMIVVLAFAAASITHLLGIEAVLGAFIIGLLVNQAPRLRHQAAHTLESITANVFAPVFFASAGVKVDLLRLADREVFIIGLIVLAIACLGKLVGAYLGSWAAGLRHWERVAMGSGMNARGAMEIVVATIGLGLGVLTVEMYSIIVMVAVVTSLMAPPLLRWSLSKIEIGADEARRLETEAIAASSFVRQIRRVLFTTRSPVYARTAAQIIAYLSQAQQMEVMAVHARPLAVRRRWWNPWGARWRRFVDLGRVAAEDLKRSLGGFKGTHPEFKQLSDPDRTELVLVEASRGYDVLVVADVRRSDRVATMFAGVVDEIVRRSPIPAILVIDRPTSDGAPEAYRVWRPHLILVPTDGTEHGQRAVEMASVVAASAGATVLVLHVIRVAFDADVEQADAEADLAQEIVARQADWGRKFGAEVEGLVVRGGNHPERDILRVAKERNADLLVIGSKLRVVSRRAFFGHRVERLVKGSRSPVMIVSSG